MASSTMASLRRQKARAIARLAGLPDEYQASALDALERITQTYALQLGVELQDVEGNGCPTPIRGDNVIPFPAPPAG